MHEPRRNRHALLLLEVLQLQSWDLVRRANGGMTGSSIPEAAVRGRDHRYPRAMVPVLLTQSPGPPTPSKIGVQEYKVQNSAISQSGLRTGTPPRNLRSRTPQQFREVLPAIRTVS